MSFNGLNLSDGVIPHTTNSAERNFTEESPGRLILLAEEVPK